MENLDDELKDFSLLRDLKRQGDGFHTPENYFDHLDDQIFGHLEAMGARRPTELQAKRGGQWLRKRMQPRLLTALAAGLAVIAVAVWFFKPQPTLNQPTLAQVNVPDLSEEDIETYVLENVHEFDTEQLASLPPVETVEQIPEPTTIKPNPHRTKRQQALDNLHPEDLDNLLNDLSDEDLEKLL